MENDYFYIDEQKTKGKIFVLIIYDIVDNRRRTKLVKFLQGYGFRIQKSAFEAILKKDVFEKLVSKIGRYATDEDSIRVYKMVGKEKVYNFGKESERIIEAQDAIII